MHEIHKTKPRNNNNKKEHKMTHHVKCGYCKLIIKKISWCIILQNCSAWSLLKSVTIPELLTKAAHVCYSDECTARISIETPLKACIERSRRKMRPWHSIQKPLAFSAHVHKATIDFSPGPQKIKQNQKKYCNDVPFTHENIIENMRFQNIIPVLILMVLDWTKSVRQHLTLLLLIMSDSSIDPA